MTVSHLAAFIDRSILGSIPIHPLKNDLRRIPKYFLGLNACFGWLMPLPTFDSFADVVLKDHEFETVCTFVACDAAFL